MISKLHSTQIKYNVETQSNARNVTQVGLTQVDVVPVYQVVSTVTELAGAASTYSRRRTVDSRASPRTAVIPANPGIKVSRRHSLLLPHLRQSDSCRGMPKLFPDMLIMVALWNRADHYIFALWFLLLLSSFFPRLISAVADWMSAILPHMVWP